MTNCSTRKNQNDFYQENANINLFAFVGEKISVIEFDPNAESKDVMEIDSITGETIIRKRHIMDRGFRCKYVVKKNIFNKLESDTVNFVAYDHYGRPNFEKSKFVLLYISKNKDKNHYFHQKYQFDALEIENGNYYGEIFKRKNSVWVSHRKKVSVKELFEWKKKNEFQDIFQGNAR